MALLPLLDRPPWVRRGKGGAEERWASGAWQAVEAGDRLRLGQQEAQVRSAVCESLHQLQGQSPLQTPTPSTHE